MHFYTKICALILWLFRCETCNQNSSGSYRWFLWRYSIHFWHYYFTSFPGTEKKIYFVQRKKLTTDFICHSPAALCKSIIRIERFHWIALTKLFYLASKILILNSKHQKNIEKSFPMLFNSLQKWNTNVICVCFYARQFMDPFVFSTLCSTP